MFFIGILLLQETIVTPTHDAYIRPIKLSFVWYSLLDAALAVAIIIRRRNYILFICDNHWYLLIYSFYWGVALFRVRQWLLICCFIIVIATWILKLFICELIAVFILLKCFYLMLHGLGRLLLFWQFQFLLVEWATLFRCTIISTTKLASHGTLTEACRNQFLTSMSSCSLM